RHAQRAAETEGGPQGVGRTRPPVATGGRRTDHRSHPVAPMILLFPDLDTLRLALTSNVVPSDVTLAPAAVTTDEQGRLYVEPTLSLSKAVAKSLDRRGVKGSKRHASDAPQEVSIWVQFLTVVRVPCTPNLTAHYGVVF